MSADGSPSDAIDQATGDVTVNVVACESCRSKKCKCDRQLPRCTQCRKTRSECTYPESYKRGFPQGYLTGLEKRLLETETALFETLFHAHSQSGNDDAQRAAATMAERWHKQSKADKMQEWVQMPLRSQEERTAWLMQKADYASSLRETTLTPAETQSNTSFTEAQAQAHARVQAREHEAAAGLLGINRSRSHFQDTPEKPERPTRSEGSGTWFGLQQFVPQQPMLETPTYQYPHYMQQQQTQQISGDSPRADLRSRRPADILTETDPSPAANTEAQGVAEAQALSSSQAHKFF